jgi:hypothetical protein
MDSTTPTARTTTATDDLWGSLEYEVWMYGETRRLLRANRPGQESLQYAIVESALLHARVLTEALIDQGKRPTDLRLADVLPESARSDDLRTAIGELEKAYGTQGHEGDPCWHLNKRVMHLTKNRTPSFDFKEPVFAKLDPLVERVVRLISRDTGRAFAEAIEVGGLTLSLEACASTSSVEATTRALRL